MALGLIAGLTTPSIAGPILLPDLSTTTSAAAPKIIPVRDSWAGGNDRRMFDWRFRRGGGLGFRSGNFGNHAFAHNFGDGGFRFRHHRRHFCCGDDGDALLGLGLGLGLGALAYDNYYDPYYYDSYPGYYYARGAYIGRSGFPALTSSGVTIATGRIGPGTIRSNLTTARVGSVFRPMLEAAG
ncbi:hypothetical protein ACVDG5_012105 [Mesorhizobium sp. ORM6]